MVEKIETFILGLGEDLFFSRWKLEENGIFNTFSFLFLIETLNCVDQFDVLLLEISWFNSGRWESYIDIYEGSGFVHYNS